jgi:hypothetical protein
MIYTTTILLLAIAAILLSVTCYPFGPNSSAFKSTPRFLTAYRSILEFYKRTGNTLRKSGIVWKSFRRNMPLLTELKTF